MDSLGHTPFSLVCCVFLDAQPLPALPTGFPRDIPFSCALGLAAPPGCSVQPSLPQCSWVEFGLVDRDRG